MVLDLSQLHLDSSAFALHLLRLLANDMARLLASALAELACSCYTTNFSAIVWATLAKGSCSFTVIKCRGLHRLVWTRSH